jgi:hypothetical protein
MQKIGIPQTPPALVIGTANVQKLHEAGYRIVPSVATAAMKDAAANVMRKSHDAGLPWVGSREKAAIRWEAMLAAWDRDYDGLRRGVRLDPEPLPPIRKRWRLGRWFEFNIGWLVERP